MFDYFEPNPSLKCPKCGKPLKEWQGKDGPCALFVWRQGQIAPITQRADEDCRIRPEALAKERLPPQFLIYTECCSKKFMVNAVGFVDNAVWSKTRLIGADDVDEFFSTSPRSVRSELKGWLRGGI